LFTNQQRALLAYTDVMTREINGADDVFAEIRKHFSERQVVELTMLIGAYHLLT
jgi:alkylhydroperoxidase family enzyme